MFEIKTVAKLKTKELEAIIADYEKAGIKAPEGGFANNSERSRFIEETYAEDGMVHIVTEEDVKNNNLDIEGDVKEGDAVLLPVKTEEEVKEGLIEELVKLVADSGMSSQEVFIEESSKLDIPALSKLIDDIRVDGVKNADTPDSGESEEDTHAPSEEEIAKAIESGNVRYEGQLVVGSRPVVTQGKLFREVDTGAARYHCEISEFAKLIKKAKKD